MTSTTHRLRIPVDGAAVSAVVTAPDHPDPVTVILAPGAGNDMDSPFLTTIHEGLAAAGLAVVRFNFLYREQGRKAPDPPAPLKQVWQAVIEHVRQALRPRRLYIGGKSMGGRMASLLVAEGAQVDGLILLGYPLHPAGKPAAARSAHFPAIACPSLFIAGTRDPLSRLDLLESAIETLGRRATLHLIEGGDHSFTPLKSQGRTVPEVLAEVVEVVCTWLDRQEAARQR